MEESPPAEVIVGYTGFISFQTWGEKSRNLGNFYEQSSKENEVPWYVGFSFLKCKLGRIQDKGPSDRVGFTSSPLELLILAKIHSALVRPSQSLLLKFGSELFQVITQCIVTVASHSSTGTQLSFLWLNLNCKLNDLPASLVQVLRLNANDIHTKQSTRHTVF